MKKLVTLIALTLASLVYSQDELPFLIVSPVPQSNVTNVVDVLNNWPMQVVLVKQHVWVPIDPKTKYYVDYDGKRIDSFLYKDFVSDTLKKNYLIKINNPNVHYMNFGPVSLQFKAVAILTGIEDESISEAKKHRYFDMIGREMLEPKGMVVREDGKRFVYE